MDPIAAGRKGTKICYMPSRRTRSIPTEPQVFDLLVFLIENRDRVISKEDLIASVWRGRLVSESTLSSRINAARKAIGDSGEQQNLIRTVARKGLRFVATLHEPTAASPDALQAAPGGPLFPLSDRQAIAVLPFNNMSGDHEQEYFSDGISEDLITALSKQRWFLVIARNSSFAYEGKAVHLKQIADELGVRYVIEGSVRKSGGRVRITAQLNDAATGSHLWGADTTAIWRTSSPCRMRLPMRLSRPSNRSSMPRRISAPSANRRTAWMPGIW